MTPIEITSPRFANSEQTMIDCVVVFDTMPTEQMPFTASPDDVTPYGQAIFSACLSGAAGDVAPYVAPPAQVPKSITRRQLLLQLIAAGLISLEEGIAAAQSGAVPASIAVVFDGMSATDRAAAYITWASMSVAERENPLVAALAASNNMDADALDDFFRAAAEI